MLPHPDAAIAATTATAAARPALVNPHIAILGRRRAGAGCAESLSPLELLWLLALALAM